MFRSLKRTYSLLAVCAVLLPAAASAHENYVLPADQIGKGMNDTSYHVLDALRMPHNLQIALAVSLGGFFLFLLYLFFVRSKAGNSFHDRLLKLEPAGHVLLRVALGVSFIASAYTSSYLGPEISVFSLPLGAIIHPALYILGAMLIAGLYAEAAGALGLITLVLAMIVYRDYMLTYFNYFGEFIALLFFGSRTASADGIIRGAKKIPQKYRDLEKAVIRITYGISILYPAISIKLLHPLIIIEIVNTYHLNSIHWLFPSDPLLIALGTGIAQTVVGVCLILGLFTRLNTLITFVLMVMSVFFFREAVWPHYILLALALYLMVTNGGEWGLDGLIRRRKIKN